jgi:hypothetical protein
MRPFRQIERYDQSLGTVPALIHDDVTLRTQQRELADGERRMCTPYSQ